MDNAPVASLPPPEAYPFYGTATSDYPAREATNELGFAKNDKLYIISGANEGLRYSTWFEAVHKGRRGIVPAIFVQREAGSNNMNNNNNNNNNINPNKTTSTALNEMAKSMNKSFEEMSAFHLQQLRQIKNRILDQSASQMTELIATIERDKQHLLVINQQLTKELEIKEAEKKNLEEKLESTTKQNEFLQAEGLHRLSLPDIDKLFRQHKQISSKFEDAISKVRTQL